MDNKTGFSLKETWDEYLGLINKFIPERAKKITGNKKILYPVVALAVVQLVVYSAIAIYWFRN